MIEFSFVSLYILAVGICLMSFVLGIAVGIKIGWNNARKND
jgi:hypothetical protein